MDKEEDLPEEELEDEVEEEEKELDRPIARSVNIHTLNTQVEITSSAEEDTLDVLVDTAEKILDKYAINRY